MTMHRALVRTAVAVVAGVAAGLFWPTPRAPVVDPAGRDPHGAERFFLDQRLAPGREHYPTAHVLAARHDILLRERAIRDRKSSRRPPGDVVGWRELGPGNVGGRTRAIAIDPDRPSTLYAGGVAGGVWKSDDGGESWRQMDDTMASLAVTAIILDPGDPSTLYAATGEGFSWGGMVRGYGIFKSSDSGESWFHLEGTVEGVPEGAFHWVNDLAISPSDPGRLYAATRFGVWRTTDAGATWEIALANPVSMTAAWMTRGSTVGCTQVEVRADGGSDIVFAAFGSREPDGLYRSSDGGDSWSRLDLGDRRQGRMAVAIALSDPDVMYVSMAQNIDGVFGMLHDVYRSDDGGDTWRARVDFTTPTGRWLLSSYFLAAGCGDGPIYHQGWYDNVVAVDPMDPDIVWVGGIDLFRSTDGGRTFLVGEGTLGDSHIGFLHVDHHAIVFHPDYDGVDNQTMYLGNDGGISRTHRARGLATTAICPANGLFFWKSLNNSYAVTQFYHGDSARDRVAIVAGSQDNGTVLAIATDTPDDWRLIWGGDGGYVAIDPTNSRTMYVEMQLFPNIFKTTDGGHSFVDVSDDIDDEDGLFIAPFAMDQAHPDTLWTGGGRPWRTLDGASTWRPVGSPPPGGGRISAIAIAPSDPEVVYLGFSTGTVMVTATGRDPSPQWRSNWDSMPDAFISSLAVDPADPDLVYATISTFGVDHVWRSEDGGDRWHPLPGIHTAHMPDIPAHWIAVRPCNHDQLFVATELGVFVSDDGGGTWDPANPGLAHTVVEALDFMDDDTLIAFTYGRGAFMTDLLPCPAPRRSGDRQRPSP